MNAEEINARIISKRIRQQKFLAFYFHAKCEKICNLASQSYIMIPRILGNKDEFLNNPELIIYDIIIVNICKMK